MKKPTFSYPDQPPSWLDQWPAKIEIDRQFSLGIRNTARMIGSRESIKRLEWTDSTLELILGVQRPVWRFDGRDWHRSCTCGYPEAACVHCWLAAYLFQTVCQVEEWFPKGESTESSSDESFEKKGSGRSPPLQSENGEWPRRASWHSAQPDLFSGSLERPASSPVSGQTVHRGLEVEADFHYQPGRITLRFYCVENERRRLMTMQEVQRLGSRFHQDQTVREKWPAQDADFFKWLYRQYRDKTRSRLAASSFFSSYPRRHPGTRQGKSEDFPELRLSIEKNLNVLKMFEARFEKWQEQWREVPGRFIERESQKPLSYGPQECRMRFEVFPDREMVRVAAVIVLPDGGRYHFHEIFQLLAEGKKRLIIDGRLLDFTPPVDWVILTDFFARKSPGIPRGRVAEYLPGIIQNRFDLLHGDILSWKKETDAPLRLTAASDGGDIILSAGISGAAIHPGHAKPAGDLHEGQDGRLSLTFYESPDLPVLRDFMSSLPLTRNEDSQTYRLPGQVEAVGEFLEKWRRLSEGIEKKYAPELAPLLDSAAKMFPLLSLRRIHPCLEVRLYWLIAGVRLQDNEVLAAMGRSPPVARSVSGHWLAVDPSKVENLRRQLSDAGFGNNSRLQLFRPDARRLLLDLQERQVEYEVSNSDRGLHDEVINQPESKELPLPLSMRNQLRDYQKTGFEFLADRLRYRIGAILADDMGLGKTVQVLALLQAVLSERREAGRAADANPLAMVVTPASVSSVWEDEVGKFCPGLACEIYAGSPEQRRAILQAGDWDLLIANYALVRNDIASLEQCQFDLVILDEAQQIKNPEAQASQAVKRLQGAQRLALTGTPLENRLLDLWSIMDFLNPGFLEARDKFIKAGESPERAAELGRKIAPVMLRRTKGMVATELPERIEEVIRVEMDEAQRSFYDRLLEETREKAEQTNTAVEMLALLTRLRQACCHPQLIRDHSHQIEESVKQDVLLGMIEELAAENHSILVYSQFVGMLELLEAELSERNLDIYKITGSTPVDKRAGIVRDFNQSEEPGVFLLSLKAAGTGLTLTRADYVFIYDPWWNPAVENQAIDRAHRIGQTKSVVAYRLVTANTVEDKVMEMQKHKAELFDSLVADPESDTAAPLTKLGPEQLRRLLE